MGDYYVSTLQPLMAEAEVVAIPDPLDVAIMGLHVAHMTGPADMSRCYAMVTN